MSTRPVLSIKEKYNIWHENYHGKDKLHKIQLFDWHRNVISEIGNLESLKGKKILEVGCGVGDFSILLSKYGSTVTGIDFSEYAIRMALDKSIKQKIKVNFQIMDAQNLDFVDEQFDMILSCECLEHLPNPLVALSEMFRVLKPGGNIILTTENYSNSMAYTILYNKLRGRPFDSGSGVQPVENFFVFWKVNKMFRKVGFKQMRYWGTRFIFLMLPGFPPDKFSIDRFQSEFFNVTFKPFARHMLYHYEK